MYHIFRDYDYLLAVCLWSISIAIDVPVVKTFMRVDPEVEYLITVANMPETEN